MASILNTWCRLLEKITKQRFFEVSIFPEVIHSVNEAIVFKVDPSVCGCKHDKETKDISSDIVGKENN